MKQDSVMGALRRIGGVLVSSFGGGGHVSFFYVSSFFMRPTSSYPLISSVLLPIRLLDGVLVHAPMVDC
jgi:hypothetical protein